MNKRSTENKDGSKDLGIMQLNSECLADFSFRYNEGVPIDPWMWRTSIDVGIAHLSRLYRTLGYWEGAVAAYNLGLTKYRRYKNYDIPLPDKTRMMVSSVVR